MPGMPRDRSNQVSIILPDQYLERLRKEVDEENVTRSRVVNRWIEHYFLSQGDIGEDNERINALEAAVKDVNESLDVTQNQLSEVEERNRSLIAELERERSSRTIVEKGLQHQIELLQQKVDDYETLLQEHKEHVHELKDDKVTLQKQVELLTLRLPEAKIKRRGFWERLFKREEASP